MARSARELVESGPKLASPPLIYGRLVAAIQDPRSRSSDIAQILQEDPGLAARILRVVNSAFYAFPKRIETVSQAVTVVGTAQIRDLALATSVISVFRNVPRDLVDMKGFWSHSLGCGVAARVLASHLREYNIERYFVAGLIHDVGRLVIFIREGDKARKAIEMAHGEGLLLQKAEREVLGFDHAQVGGFLMDAWNLPASFREAVAYHHQPGRAEHFPREAAAVHVSDIISNAMEMGSGGQHRVPELEAGAWDTLGLDPALVPVILEEVERQHTGAVHTIMGLVA